MPPPVKREKEDGKSRELAQIEELKLRVISEAPEPGTNPLSEEVSEVSATEGKLVYTRAKKFSELPISLGIPFV